MAESTPYNHFSGTFVKVSSPTPYVALVELSRAPVNAFHEPFWVEMGKIFDKLGEEPTVRAVVLASAIPKLFSAGIDFSALSLGVHLCHRALPAPRRRCAHGVAYGLSIDILSACDIRYAAENARFSIKEVDVGLAADIGTLARVPKVTGNASFVNELALTGRDFSAAEALQCGLVSKVVPGSRDEVVAAALATATLIASKSPVAARGTKRVLLHARDHSVEENLHYVAVWNSAMLQTQDLMDSIKAARTKSKAKFAPLAAKL
ncbi:ClpP/crotonase [Epithele typhae]|uniref:ClpP/crotonase n=1 Tax=Epithele typhae TaxID=378194 RepID=UPI002008B030|nr:ClpP/crotonase [Epithele typhae]KAH9920527.1 ClpP/crotonase [Epithele typhae]